MIGRIEGCLASYPHPVFRLDMQGCCFYITYTRDYLPCIINDILASQFVILSIILLQLGKRCVANIGHINY
jgi:hypothetical protein